ncbi:hypothetical protein TcCL_Unassigned01856, partial [Trypanosoma cruzi]
RSSSKMRRNSMLVAGASSFLIIYRLFGWLIYGFVIVLIIGSNGLMSHGAIPGRRRDRVVFHALRCSCLSGGRGSPSRLHSAGRTCSTMVAGVRVVEFI